MKPFYLNITIIVFLVLYTNRIQAQPSQTGLNQTELSKQFLGTWKAEVTKDH
jgi:hypothetical protein